MTDLAWMDEALCKEYDPDIWFPGSGRRVILSKAKRICYSCKVFAECRIYSLTIRIEEGPDSIQGVWAGLNKKERSDLSVAKTLLSEAKGVLAQREGSYG